MKKFDYNRYATMKWDSDILSLIAKIHEYKGRQEYYIFQHPEELKQLIIVAKAQSTEASNAIEGIRTTQTRLLQICAEKTAPKTREEYEIAGYRDVLNTIHENYEYIPIQPNYILQLHRDLLSHTGKSIGGHYKNSQNYICETDSNGNSRTLFTPLAPHETAPAIEELCRQFNLAIDKQEVDSLLLIPIFIHDFLCIHPFTDGNGRMSRLLTTLLLYQSGFFVGKYISLENKIAKTKDAYYTALSESQSGWNEGEEDVSPFIRYLLGTIISAYRDFEDRVNLSEGKMSALETVRTAISRRIGRFTKGDIVAVCPTIGKTSVGTSLKILVDNGEIIRDGKSRATFYIRADSIPKK